MCVLHLWSQRRACLCVPMQFCSCLCPRATEALLVSVPTLSLGLAGGCDELRAADWASLQRWDAEGYLPEAGLQGLQPLLSRPGANGGRAAGPACTWPQGGSGTRFFSFPLELPGFPAAPAHGAFLEVLAILLQLPMKGLCQAGRQPEGDTVFALHNPVLSGRLQLSTFHFYCY